MSDHIISIYNVCFNPIKMALYHRYIVDCYFLLLFFVSDPRINWCAVIYIFDIGCGKMGVGGGYSAVDEALGGMGDGSLGGGVSRLI